jgi:hypothetical protein
MKSLFYFLLPLLGLLSSTCYTVEFLEYPIISEEKGQITIHNRILTKFNNKTYSVLDVVKKMDVIFDNHYPQFAHSKLARYQFYNAQWKDTLQKMLDQELILLDAERMGIKATDAEVREELLRKYGPNVMLSLDQLKLSYEEALKAVSEDLIAEKILYFKVYSEALRVRPNDIKEKYLTYCKENPASQKWHYQVLTIGSENENISQALAQLALDLLKKKKDLQDISKDLQLENPNATVLFTPEIIRDDQSISQSHKMVIETLNPGDFSNPVLLMNKDQSIVHRIFYLKEKHVINPPEFPKLAEKIKDGLIQKSIALHLENYMKKLKIRYGFSEQDLTINSDFKPFSYQ